jgi:hypothetical protein
MRKEDPRYPLSWPFGWKRTPPAARRHSSFKEATEVTRQQWNPAEQEYKSVVVSGNKTVGMRAACARLEDQLERLGANDVVLSTNVELTLSGEPRGDRRVPEDPGVAVYFKLKDHDRVLACDKWETVSENIAAIANHIDALRRVERYGVGTVEQAFEGYDRLPPPSAENRPAWRKVLGFKEFSPVTKDDVQVNYRALAKLAATDEGRLMTLNVAREAALREIGDGVSRPGAQPLA